MVKKLKHKIVVFTGGLASGKSTVKNTLIKVLEDASIPYLEISGLKDLYLPFAVQKKLIKKKVEYQRSEATALMEKVYKKYGKDLGSRLLYIFLQKKSDGVIYLLDSKRNPEGILELKKFFKNVLVVGTYATWSERIQRYMNRQREFDVSGGCLVDPVGVFKHEEDVFNISKSILLSDLIIENHTCLPNVVEVDLFRGLVECGFISSVCKIKDVLMPQRAKDKTTKKGVLQSCDIPGLLDEFVVQNSSRDLFVVQGGNRYISFYLKNKKIKFYNIKLLDLNKVKFSVVLNTILSPRERVSPVNESSRKLLSKLYYKLPIAQQKRINKVIKGLGFVSVEDWLVYTTRGELLDVFADFFVNTPFAYPADDRRIKKEFDLVYSFSEQVIRQMGTKDIIKAILSDCLFCKILSQSKRGITFIDDVFYRGRTYYAILIITGLLDIPHSHWKLTTICADKVSKNIYVDGVEVMRRDVLYPFENNINTEMGYWEESKRMFVFRDIQWYYIFLIATCKTQKEMGRICLIWSKMVGAICKQLNDDNCIVKMRRALVEFYIFSLAHNLKIYTESVIDQRSRLSGYCISFVKILSFWINQKASRWQRQLFKNEVKAFLHNGIIDKRREVYYLTSPAVKFYKKNFKIIDLMFLNNIFQTGSSLETRECEVKFALLDDVEAQKIRQRLLLLGFVPGEEQLETDFIPDTKDFLCRKNNLLLRFRQIRRKGSDDILLTLKMGKTNIEGFQDAKELQYSFSDIQLNIFDSIVKIIKIATSVELPREIHDRRDLKDLRIFLAQVGFPALRTLVEKKRTVYINEDSLVTFDIFPGDIGRYLEIETKTPEALQIMIDKLGIPRDQLEIRDYGDIIKAKKSHLSEIDQRTALF